MKNIFLVLLFIIFLNNCSINKLAVNKVAEMLSSDKGSTVFTGDDDPQLIGEALPFALKLYEALLEQVPDNAELCMATGKAYSLYAFGYIQTPAEQLSDNEIEEQINMLKRAKKLYVRARKYLLQAMEIRHPGFTNTLQQNKLDQILKSFTKEDVPYLYWLGLSWMGAFTADKFDMELAVSHPKAVKMIERVLMLDPHYDNGGVQDFFISYYGSLPAGMGGSETKAREFFKRSIEISKGLKAAPYLNLATSVSINNQNAEEFQSLLNQVLAIDLNKSPDNRLLNTISQQKAKWLLDHMDNYFLNEKGDIK